MVTKAGGLLWNQDNSKDPYIKHLWVFMLSLNHYTFSFITNFLSLCYVLGTKLSILYAFCMVSCSVNFSCPVMPDSLQPHGLQHGRLPCPSVIPRAYLNSCPLSRWHHPTISSSVVPFSSCLHSFPASGSFPSESVLLIRWPQHWSFSFSISPSNEYSGLIFFRMDWLDLLVVQGTLKSLLKHHNSKASILWHSAFFIVQLSYSYMTTGKTIALTRQIFVGKGLCFLICCLDWS